MDIQRILKLSYEDYVNELKVKYGPVGGNYFIDTSCQKPNKKIKKGNLGLFIHHIDEDKAILLAEPKHAILNPFEYQLANRLVYCNLLEHLILHIKIMENPHKDKNINEDVGVGGVYVFLIPELNDIYSNCEYKLDWKKKVAENVINNKQEYFECIKLLMTKFKEYPLNLYLTSLKALYGGYDINNNKKVFDEIINLYNSINK